LKNDWQAAKAASFFSGEPLPGQLTAKVPGKAEAFFRPCPGFSASSMMGTGHFLWQIN
jgi:hypothetical protein